MYMYSWVAVTVLQKSQLPYSKSTITVLKQDNYRTHASRSLFSYRTRRFQLPFSRFACLPSYNSCMVAQSSTIFGMHFMSHMIVLHRKVWWRKSHDKPYNGPDLLDPLNRASAILETVTAATVLCGVGVYILFSFLDLIIWFQLWR